MNQSPSRIQSIDVFRALTMLLMIFVNDLWTLKGVPKWMEHSETFEDYMGLADIVFPCFLFIVGMSIPFAIQRRVEQGDSNIKIICHIGIRTIALLLMGIFTVNLGSFDPKLVGISEPVFEIIMVLGFFLCWNVYPGGKEKSKQYIYLALQVIGFIILIVLAYIYRSKLGSDGQVHWLRIKWWGILGLIGWAYGLTALIYLFFKTNILLIALAWLFFTIFNIAGHAGVFGMHSDLSPVELIPGNGAFQSFALAGLIGSLIILKYASSFLKKISLLFGLGTGMLLIGLFLHPLFIISKNLATPVWVFFSCSIAYFLFAFLHWLVDNKRKYSWFTIIKPAGTNTLTCYLIPYIIYSIFDLVAFRLPDNLVTGLPGLVKSLMFAFLIIGLTALLGKLHIRLRL
jgi:heparan-alpha-glucosaminide N-acetyltransferase